MSNPVITEGRRANPATHKLKSRVTNLKRVEEHLVFVFADAENELELLVELLARHNALRLRLQQVLCRGARETCACARAAGGRRSDEVRRLLLRRARPVAERSRVGEAAGEDLLVPQDLVEFAHPRGDHRVLIEAVDLRQVAHPLLDVDAEHLTHVVQRRGARLHERLQATRPEHKFTHSSLRSLTPHSSLPTPLSHSLTHTHTLTLAHTLTHSLTHTHTHTHTHHKAQRIQTHNAIALHKEMRAHRSDLRNTSK